MLAPLTMFPLVVSREALESEASRLAWFWALRPAAVRAVSAIPAGIREGRGDISQPVVNARAVRQHLGRIAHPKTWTLSM